MIDAINSGGVRIAITILVFAAIGAGHTLYAAHRKNEKWDPSRAKGETIALGIAGAAAGVYVLYTGHSIGGVVFTAVVVVGGQIIREAVELGSESYARYEELIESGADPNEAAMAAIGHGIRESNPEEVIEGIRALVELSGKPSQETANARTDELVDTYREEGAQAALESTRLEAPEPEPPEFDDDFDLGGADEWDNFMGGDNEYDDEAVDDQDQDQDQDTDDLELEDVSEDETPEQERVIDGP